MWDHERNFTGHCELILSSSFFSKHLLTNFTEGNIALGGVIGGVGTKTGLPSFVVQIYSLEEVSLVGGPDTYTCVDVAGLLAFSLTNITVQDSFSRASITGLGGIISYYAGLVAFSPSYFINITNSYYFGTQVSVTPVNFGYTISSGSGFLNNVFYYSIPGTSYYASPEGVTANNLQKFSNDAELEQLVSANFDTSIWEGVFLSFLPTMETDLCPSKILFSFPPQPKGAKGVKGDDVSKGVKGVKGVDKPKGVKGVAGTNGVKGATGEKGVAGANGEKGVAGHKGLKGSTGPAGKPSSARISSRSRSEEPQLIAEVVTHKRGSLSSPQTYTLKVDNASVFVVGEVLYISNAGYFQVVSLTTNSITVCFLYKDVTDNGRIFSGAQIVSAGVQGEKGLKGRVASTILTCTPGTSQNTFTITVDDSTFVVPGSVVYLQGSGYFRIQKTVQSNTFTLTLVSQASGDSGIPAVGSFLIAAGPRGRRGNNNGGGNYSRNKREKKERKQVRVEERFFLFSSSSLEKQAGEAKKETALNLSEKISVSFQGKGIFSPRNNREVSDSVESITVSKKCPEGKKLVSGKCRWNLVSTVSKKKVWCKAEDISQGEEGCSNCISSFKTMERKIEGQKEQVVTSIVFTKADGNKEKV